MIRDRLVNCVKDQFVYLINDLSVNNPHLFKRPLHEVLPALVPSSQCPPPRPRAPLTLPA